MIDAGRRTKREVLFRSSEDGAAALDARVDRGDVPDEHAEINEAAVRVNRALEGLPGHQRAAFDLVRSDGLSIVETASALGTTPCAVKLRVHRVYLALRAVLADEGPTRSALAAG
jgi:RNA polymerase sigma-70 factor (ECF subfamily)